MEKASTNIGAQRKRRPRPYLQSGFARPHTSYGLKSTLKRTLQRMYGLARRSLCEVQIRLENLSYKKVVSSLDATHAWKANEHVANIHIHLQFTISIYKKLLKEVEI